MLLAGLTGGIGSGKSTFAALLAERGAHVIDVDALGHDALRPGEAAWHSVVDQFGEEVLSFGSMTIDRKRLAAIVFNDRDKLAALNAIVHPVIFSRVADDLERLHGTDAVVVIDAAIIVETGMDKNLDLLIAVVASGSLRRERLTIGRAMSLADIRARMATQASTEDIVAKADVVVENNGSLADLASEADRVWAELEARRAP